MREWPQERFGLLMPLIGMLLLIILALLSSCRSSRIEYVSVESVRIDSVTVKDTVISQLLVPYRDSVATADTTSYLSNPYAYSRATWSKGQLQHTLGIWPAASVVVRVPYYIDRYVYRSVPKVVEVEKKLSRWQQIKLQIGGIAICLIIVCLILFLFRK